MLGRALPALLCLASIALTGCLPPRLPDESALLVEENPFLRDGGLEAGPPGLVPAAEVEGAEGTIEDTRVSIRRFCVDALANGSSLRDGDDRLAVIETRLVEHLRERGFGVVRSGPLNETWTRAFGEAGPVYDVHTGEADAEALGRARRHAMAALEAEHGCRFLATPSLVTVSAAWRNGIAGWDGTVERFGTGGGGAYGSVGALSLHVSIRDGDWRKVYFGTGGIQLTARVVDSFWSSGFETIPDDELLRDANRIEQAIQGALRDLETPLRHPPEPH